MANGSVVLDLKDPDDRELAAKLIHRSDVVVENFRTGLMDELGLGFDAMRVDHPGLIYFSIQGFATNASRRTNVEPHVAELNRTFANGSADHWISVLREAGVPAGPINSIGEAFVWAEQHGLQPTHEFEIGATRTVRSPIRFSGNAIGAPLPPPRLDEHGDELRGWLKRDDKEGMDQASSVGHQNMFRSATPNVKRPRLDS